MVQETSEHRKSTDTSGSSVMPSTGVVLAASLNASFTCSFQYRWEQTQVNKENQRMFVHVCERPSQQLWSCGHAAAAHEPHAIRKQTEGLD